MHTYIHTYMGSDWRCQRELVVIDTESEGAHAVSRIEVCDYACMYVRMSSMGEGSWIPLYIAGMRFLAARCSPSSGPKCRSLCCLGVFSHPGCRTHVRLASSLGRALGFFSTWRARACWLLAVRRALRLLRISSRCLSTSSAVNIFFFSVQVEDVVIVSALVLYVRNVCLYTCIYTYVHTYTRKYMYIYIYIYIYLHAHIHTCICLQLDDKGCKVDSVVAVSELLPSPKSTEMLKDIDWRVCK
jgi:hypothetical protein